MVKSENTRVSKTRAARRGGSNPPAGTRDLKMEDHRVYNLAHQWGREAEAHFKKAREILESGEKDNYWASRHVEMGEETFLHASQLLDACKPKPLPSEQQQADKMAATIMGM